jgi:hypothetical protein
MLMKWQVDQKTEHHVTQPKADRLAPVFIHLSNYLYYTTKIFRKKSILLSFFVIIPKMGTAISGTFRSSKVTLKL